MGRPAESPSAPPYPLLLKVPPEDRRDRSFVLKDRENVVYILDDPFVHDELVHETSAAPGVNVSAERLAPQEGLFVAPLSKGAGLGPYLARRAYERGIRLEVRYESERAVDCKD